MVRDGGQNQQGVNSERRVSRKGAAFNPPRNYINFPELISLICSYHAAAIRYFKCPLGKMKSDESYLSIPSWKEKSTGKGNFFLDLNGFSVTGKMNSFEGKTECGSIYKAINMRHQGKKKELTKVNYLKSEITVLVLRNSI